MRDLIFFICFLVVGFLIGYYLYVTRRDQIRKLFHRKPKTKNKRKNMLEERMKKQNQSWTEWSCDLDEEDASEHILSFRKKRTQHTALRRKKERTDLFFFLRFFPYYKCKQKGG